MVLPPPLADSSKHLVTWVWLYIGPDVFLPITTAFAAIAGVALMFWQRLVGLFRKLWSLVSRRSG